MIRRMIPFLKEYGPPVFAGALLALCFPTFHWWFLAWIALTPLLLKTHSASPRRAALHFFVAGWTFHSVLLQWLTANIFWAGGWALIGYQLLCMFLALYWAVLGYLWNLAQRRVPAFLGPIALALLWVAIEYVQARFPFGGFGWSALGNSQGKDLYFAQCAAIGGVPLLSGLLVAANGWIATALARKSARWASVTALVVTVAASHVVGGLLLQTASPDGPAYRVGLVQPNYPQELKWDPDYLVEMVERAAYLSRLLDSEMPVDLIVWPEALVMDDYRSPAFLPVLESLVTDTGAALFAGVVRASPGSFEGYNSAVLFDAEGVEQGVYDKVRLAPFGEYVPLGAYLPFLRQLVPGGEVVAGRKQKLFSADGRRMGPLICFEVLFPQMAEALRRQGADFLIVVTNLAWFGGSNAIAQELELARFRAIETRLPVVHSANTGISGVFDPFGRFSMVDMFVDSDGQLRRLNSDLLEPRMLLRRRALGVFQLPPAAHRPISWGPRWIPAGAALLGCITGVASLFLAFQKRRTG